MMCLNFHKDGREILCKDSPKPKKKNSKSSYDKIARLVIIHRMIKNGNYPSSERIINTCRNKLELDGYTESTKCRDLDFLRDFFRAPLEYDHFQRGYYYTDKNFKIDFDKMDWV